MYNFTLSFLFQLLALLWRFVEGGADDRVVDLALKTQISVLHRCDSMVRSDLRRIYFLKKASVLINAFTNTTSFIYL